MNKIHTLEPGNEEITAKKIITVSDARLNFFQVFYSQLLWLSCVLYSMIFFGLISSFRNQYNHRCFKEQILTFLLCIYYSPTSLSPNLLSMLELGNLVRLTSSKTKHSRDETLKRRVRER